MLDCPIRQLWEEWFTELSHRQSIVPTSIGKSLQRLVLIDMNRLLLRLGAKVLTTSAISMYIVSSTW